MGSFEKNAVLSVDANFVRVARSLGISAMTIPGLMQLGVQLGRVSFGDSANVKSTFGRYGWRQIPFTAGDLVAILKSDSSDRDADFHALVSTAQAFDLRIAAFIATAVLDEVGPNVPDIDGQSADVALFRRLRAPAPDERAHAMSLVRSARRAWYKRSFRAWINGDFARQSVPVNVDIDSSSSPETKSSSAGTE